jgi:hypothetical protein
MILQVWNCRYYENCFNVCIGIVSIVEMNTSIGLSTAALFTCANCLSDVSSCRRIRIDHAMINIPENFPQLSGVHDYCLVGDANPSEMINLRRRRATCQMIEDIYFMDNVGSGRGRQIARNRSVIKVWQHDGSTKAHRTATVPMQWCLV